jgi:predicted RND superfamily exporter protein
MIKFVFVFIFCFLFFVLVFSFGLEKESFSESVSVIFNEKEYFFSNVQRIYDDGVSLSVRYFEDGQSKVIVFMDGNAGKIGFN